MDFREIVGAEAHAGEVAVTAAAEGVTMIDWDSATWGGGVTYAADGSWLGDKQAHREPPPEKDDD